MSIPGLFLNVALINSAWCYVTIPSVYLTYVPKIL